MKDYQFPTGHEPAFLLGCGRFRMEEHLLEKSAEEIVRFGRHSLFVCDDNSHRVAFDTVAASLRAAGVEPRELRHKGLCCRDDALAYAEAGTLDGVDAVIGCGGGVILDFSKCLADIAGAPLVTIPTSSATCCAYTPIAVCYTREGRYISTSHFRREVAAALLDTSVLSRQPQRLLAAGALDAMAKKIELEFWLDVPDADGGAASRLASLVSDFIYRELDEKIDTAIEDLRKGEPTPALRDVFYHSIVGAGFVSGVTGGSRQTALAHRFYYGMRQLNPTMARRWTHGELVAVGLILQLAYYGRNDDAEALAARLRKWGLPASMGELGMPFGPKDADDCFDYLLATKTMKAVGPETHPRLREALGSVFR